MYPNRRGIQKRRDLKREQKLALSFFHAESIFFFFLTVFCFFCMSPTYSMHNISYSHIFSSLVAGDDMSEVFFNVASTSVTEMSTYLNTFHV